MYKVQRVSTILNNQRGVSAVIVGICMFMLVSFVALAIDVGHLYVVRNELQNAADAGALAGARHLYVKDAFLINENANLIGAQAATANIGDNEYVEVINPASNADDVQRGHWSFSARTFTRWDALTPPPIWGKSADELDSIVEFVNAVQVIARRDSLPITSFFGGIFGFPSVKASRKAVAYLGASSGWYLSDFDMPIAICAQSLVDPDELWDESVSFAECIQGDIPPEGCTLNCNIGRMLNSGSKTDTHNTAGWTNFSGGTWPGIPPEQPPEEDSCSTASASDMTDLVDDLCNNVCQDIECGTSGAEELENFRDCCKSFEAGKDYIGATGGVQQVTLTSFRDCWIGASNCDADDVCHTIDEDDLDPEDGIDSKDVWNMKVPDEPWTMTVPVINCPGNNVENCAQLIGAVQVSLMWITPGGTPDPSLDTPYKMKSTNTSDTCGSSKPDWPAPENYSQLLSTLELPDGPGEIRGIPDKYFESVPVSCSDPDITPDWPSELPSLDLEAGDSLQTPLVDILSRIPGDDFTISSTGMEKIAPTSLSPLQALLGDTLMLFDIKDPGDPAPKAPDEICSLPEYEQLLLHHLADAAGEARWASVVDHFNLKNWESDQDAPLAKKSLYFLPTCCGVKPTGLPGEGASFGIMAKVPVLVD